MSLQRRKQKRSHTRIYCVIASLLLVHFISSRIKTRVLILKTPANQSFTPNPAVRKSWCRRLDNEIKRRIDRPVGTRRGMVWTISITALLGLSMGAIIHRFDIPLKIFEPEYNQSLFMAVVTSMGVIINLVARVQKLISLEILSWFLTIFGLVVVLLEASS